MWHFNSDRVLDHYSLRDAAQQTHKTRENTHTEMEGNVLRSCGIAHHTQLVRPQPKRNTTVKTVITTSLRKPLVSIGSKHNSDLPSHIEHSSLSLTF